MKMLLISKKFPTLPNVPTIAEVGYKGETLPGTWYAVYAPAGIPEEARKVLIPAIEKAVKATKAKIDQMGSIGEYRTPAETMKLQEEEYKRAYDIAVKVGLRKK
jgi:tripartite-type tricarboxylate transporter receptor subunit TctC